MRASGKIWILGGIDHGNLGNLWPRLELLRRDAFEQWKNNIKIVFPQSVYFSDDEDGRSEMQKSAEVYSDSGCLLALRDPDSFHILKDRLNCRLFLTPDITMYEDIRTDETERDGALLIIRNDK